ncbi:MAG: PAS domain S-box protein, partial [Methanoregula sp.]|nr:PAS domain S-box protein [Methanoregula sp.]
IAWNRAIEDMTGVPAGEMLGKGEYAYAVPFYSELRPMLIDLIDETDKKVSEYYTNVYRTGTSLTAETDHTHPRGHPILVLAKACHLYNQAGEITGAIESIRDVTEHKRLEMDLERKHGELLASYEQLTATEEELREQYDELAESEQRFRINQERLIMAQKTGHTGSWEYNIAMDEIWGSSEGLHIFGFHRDAGYVPIDDIEACIIERERVHQALVDLITKEREYNLEYAINPADGSLPRMIHSVARLEKDAGGRPVKVTGVIQDITDRKLQEDKLAFNNAILSTQQETSLDAILIVDANGKIINYNRQFIALWGVPEDLVAQGVDEPVLKFVTGRLADPDAFLSRVKYLYEHKDEKSFEELLLKDGRVLERFSAPMLGKSGKYYGRVWYFRDITGRKRIEGALRESEERLRLLIQHAPAALAMFDRDMRYLVASRRWIADYNLGDREIIGHSHYEIFPEISEELKAVHRRSLAGDVLSANEDKFEREDGSVQWLSWEVRPWYTDSGIIGGIIIFSEDITDRKKAEASLRESETRFSTVFRSSPVGLTLVSATDRTFVDVNDTFTRSTGYSREDVIGKTAAEVGIFASHTELEQLAAALEDQQPVHGLELQCRTKNGAIRTCRFTSGIIMMGERPHILSSIEDITEHKKAEAAFIESERRYHNLYQYALVGLFETSLKDATVIACNQQYCDLAGFASPEDARGKDVLHLYANPEDRAEIARILHEQGSITDYEARFINQKTGRRFWVRISARIDAEKDIAQGTLIDITTRKEAEDALRVSEEKYRSLTENSIDIIYSMDLEGKITHISPQVTRYGYTPDQLISHNISEVIAEEDLPRIREDIKTTVATGKSTRTTFRLKGSLENPVWLEDNGTVIKKADGVAAGISGVLRDITERMKAEEALRESEGRLRRLAENAPDMIYRMSLPGGRYEYVSPASLAMTGYTPEEFYSDPGLIRRVIHPDWHEYFRTQWNALLENKAPPFYEFQIIDKAGNIRWVNQRNLLVSDKTGKPVAIEGIVTDISRQKNSERELRRNQLRFLAVNENAGSWIWEVDPEGVYRYSSRAVNKLLGYRPEELVGTLHFYDLFDPTVREDLKTVALRAFSSREPFRDFVNLNCHKNGTPVLMSTSGAPVFDDDGTFIGYCGIDEDITERIASQSALQAMVRSMVGTTGLDSLKKITENISSWLGADCVMVGQIQPDHQTVKVISMLLDGKEVAGFTYSLKGTPCENVAEKGFCIYPDDAVRLFPESKDLVELNIRGYVGTPLRDSHNTVIGILCVLFRSPIRPSPQIQEIIDIIAVKAAAEIERIRIEHELKESQVMLAKAMDLSNMVNWEFDPVTDRFVFNDRFYALYGTSAEREGGYQMTPERYNQEFVYPDDRDAVSAVFRTAPASADPGFEFQMEHRVIRRDGAIRYIMVRVGTMAGRAGQAVRIHGANQDITERKQAEEALRQAHKKLHLLSGITRHDIGNQLMTLNGFVGLLHKKVTDPSLETYFSRITEAGRQITDMIAFTKEYEKIGVHAPVWQLLVNVVDEAGKGILPDQVLLNNDIPASLEVFADPLIVKVFFNLLDNSLRHGQRVTQIQVSSRESGNDLIVVWEDNGVGIALEDKELIFGRGFGKNTGLGMFLVREILSLTGMTIRETGTPLEGARFE